MKKFYLHQFLTGSGAFKSKREVYRALRAGEVTVDGRVVYNRLYQVRPDRRRVCWRGIPLGPQGKVYIVMNKPAGFLCSRLTPADRRLGKKSVFDLIGREFDVKTGNSLFSVGRLDEDTMGLLLLTNDGAFCSRVTSPKSKVGKTYSVTLEKPVSREEARMLEEGVVIRMEEDKRAFGYRTRKCSIRFASAGGRRLYVTLMEGRKRQVRRMFESMGNAVIRLERVAVGKLRLQDLKIRRGGYVASTGEFVEEEIFGRR